MEICSGVCKRCAVHFVTDQYRLGCPRQLLQDRGEKPVVNV